MTKFLIAIVACLWRAYVFAYLWLWFVSNKFEGIPPISYAHAYGLMIVWSVLNPPRITYADLEEHTDKEKKLMYIAATSFNVLLPAAAFGIGWILKHFV